MMIIIQQGTGGRTLVTIHHGLDHGGKEKIEIQTAEVIGVRIAESMGDTDVTVTDARTTGLRRRIAGPAGV